jgi:hypothetical protein
MSGKLLHIQQLADDYLMIDLRGLNVDPVDAIVQLDVQKK